MVGMVEGKFEFVDSQHGKFRGRGRQTRILTRQWSGAPYRAASM
jgi:hypothetical protein